MQLDDWYYSLVWHPQHLAAQTTDLLWLPGYYLVHYSLLSHDGSEKTWVWLFADMVELLRLRSLPELLPSDPNLEPIRAALPPKSSVLVQVDPRWLRDVDGLNELWFGFNYKKYYEDRNLRDSARQILSYAEFARLLAR